MSTNLNKKLKIVMTESTLKVPLLREIANVYQHSEMETMKREKLLAEIADADGLFCLLRDKIDKELLDNAPNLRVVSTLSVGYDHIDVNECRKRGVRIGYTPGVLTEATAELAIAVLLAASRRISEAINVAKVGGFVWTPHFMCGKGLYGATIGVYGLGEIGLSVADKLLSFKPHRIIYHNRHQRRDVPSATYEYVSFDELLAKSDFLIACAKPSSENAEIFNAKAFKSMRNDAVFVNVSRGSLVNHDDLYAALSDGEIGAAGLDVTTPEPLPTNSPLFRLNNCVILPHIGSATTETRERMRALAEENLVSYFAGRPMPAELT